MSNQRQPRINIDYVGAYDINAAQARIAAALNRASVELETAKREYARERASYESMIDSLYARINELEQALWQTTGVTPESNVEAMQEAGE